MTTSQSSPKLTISRTVPTDVHSSFADFLAHESGLSKAKIKDAMTKGAVLLRRGKTNKRLRRATSETRTGDVLTLAYDADILARTPPPSTLVSDQKDYSVWNKPAGMLAQGTEWGDHASLLRQVELHFKQRRQVFIVHRLDREAAGLMLVAHTKKAAAALSKLFQNNQVEKIYHAEVLGSPGDPGHGGAIDTPLHGKAAHTEYTVLSVDPTTGNASLKVRISTGRLHQIRRHLAMLGHPVLGDPRYGSRNKTGESLRLTALSLAFVCPIRRQQKIFSREKPSPPSP